MFWEDMVVSARISSAGMNTQREEKSEHKKTE